ncbi:MAG: PD-(D/E)XK nuclease family protein [Elusimicrobiaceae bacterium]|nr:PD-(D/E)XK nuclease family protein [Elusimicrobiaceae bacterium]
MTKKLSFSYSKMGMYKECPQKYKFRYIHMLPEQPKYYFAFGSALHEVMEYVYNPQNAAFPTMEQALAFFKKHWDSTSFDQKGYATMKKEMLGYEEGCRIIRAYYGKHGSSLVHPLSVEMKSTLDMDGLSLISILDRIDYLGEGRVKILDYKTGKTIQREPDQLMMYQKVAESSPAVLNLVQALDPSVTQIKVEQMCFYHLPSLQELSFERSSDKEMYEFWQRVLGVADDIRAGKFEPTPSESKCRWCDYRNICPVFTGKEYDGPSGWGAKNPAPVSAPEQMPKSDEEVLSEKIDRLGEITAEEKKLRQEIVALMNQLGYQRQYATKYQAELKTSKKLTFADRQKVVDFLRKAHLLQKTLVPTQSRIEALLSDSSVDENLKAQLLALGQEEKIEDIEISEAN